MVQRLGSGAFTAVAQVQSLVGELRSLKPRSAAKIKKKKKRERERQKGKKERKAMAVSLSKKESSG